ncbi:hypothetical protein [Parasitella parasitica]|uniref:SWR1-complex protein 5 n=1 Tax=Parasitella parasitica TaxID=35722 RepID=A0A0B7MXS4_9FUNG|nr:hypothetical protein [Parasitella parasitica]
MSSLKDFYNNPEVEEDEDSEDDEDFVPDENESDEQDLVEDDDDDEGEEEDKEVRVKAHNKGKKRELSEPEEDESTKKSRIDAIWADLNQPATLPAKKTEEAASTSATTATSTSTASTAASAIVEKKQIKKPVSPLQQKRPKSQLSSLVSKYNIKEPKMNTLEKSKLDWQGYVDREGIRDDLKYKNKDGYMEKVAFLQRVDDRRLNQLKQGQKKEKK